MIDAWKSGCRRSDFGGGCRGRGRLAFRWRSGHLEEMEEVSEVNDLKVVVARQSKSGVSSAGINDHVKCTLLTISVAFETIGASATVESTDD